MVCSLNGKITKGEEANIYSWTSFEDQKLFFSQIKKHNLIVMGSKTFEAIKEQIRLENNKLRVVLTRNVQKFLGHTKPGHLEFSSESPKELVKRLSEKGFKTMLLVGGGEINVLFLKSSLVDEVHLTIEPRIFGKGKNLISKDLFNIELKLIDCKKLNRQGTLHLKYKVLNKIN